MLEFFSVNTRASLLVAAWLLVATCSPARASTAVATDPLRQFSASIEALVTRVSPSLAHSIAGRRARTRR